MEKEMNRPIPSSRWQTSWIRGIAAALIAFSAYPVFAQGVERPYLPPGFTEPLVERPRPSPRDVLSFDGLELGERNRVLNMLDFDHSRMNWAGRALRVTVGYEHRWGPTDYYAFLPHGYEAEPNRAIAFIPTEKVRFAETFDPESDEVLRSVNRPKYTLYRDGPHVVLAHADERRWYFETPDGGYNWRIKKLEQIHHPGLYTVFEYSGSLVTALRFPNGEKVSFEYAGSFPVRIETPFGERIDLRRGAGSFIESIQVHRRSDLADENSSFKAHAHHRYERDGEGRITRYTTPDDTTYVADYRLEEVDQPDGTREIYTAILRRQRDGVFRSRRDEMMRASGDWIMEWWLGGPDDELEEASLSTRNRHRHSGSAWRISARTSSGEGWDSSYEHDRQGNPATQVSADGTVTSRHHNEMGLPTRIRSSGEEVHVEYNQFGQTTRQTAPSGEETLKDYDEHGRLLTRIDPDGSAAQFEYDDRGWPARAVVEEDEYVFAYDARGRLAKVIKPDETRVRWRYDVLGRVIERIERDTEQAIKTERYHYEGGQLTEIAHHFHRVGREMTEQFRYDARGHLRRWSRIDGRTMRYDYDRDGRLTVQRRPTGQIDRYEYHSNGRLARHTTLEPGTRPEHRIFDRDGNRLQGEQSSRNQ